MNKSVTIAIAVLVVLIMVVVALNYAGILNLNNLSNLNNQNSSTSNSYAPNVVGSSDVSSSLGGTWTQSSAGHGTSGNVSTFFNVLSGGAPGIATIGVNSPHVASPMTNGTPSQSNPFNNITSFEFSVYSPDHAGFAAVGYALFNTAANATNVFNYVYSNVSAQKGNHSYVTKGNASGHDYIYAWNYLANSNLTPSKQYESLLVGIYGNAMIGIFYLTPDNLTLSAFKTLYLDQISKMSSTTTIPGISVFVSGSNVSSSIGNHWTSTLGLDVQIHNATSILHEFIGSASGNSNITSVDMNLLNQTIGNLSEIAIQGYAAGKSNATSIGFAKFLNDKVPYLAYSTAEAAIGSNNPNATTGTISSDNVSYVFMNLTVKGFYYNSTFNSPGYNQSILVADYNDYIIYLVYQGSASVSQTQFVNLLKAEIPVV